MLGSKPLSMIFEIFFSSSNWKELLNITDKGGSRNANAYQKQKKSHCSPTGE